ncbi:hypothetical protein DTO021D3_3386 [Paecilomyces variotii]|nr:hypothetical protein DTO032I3_6588 [Paecilomyces variotii]KAJ9279595.1 hypothetical protein DTO021D3_3386 [Paecilomyces variotii]KAJ9347349.1 hypothetical protein DTO027B6_223 [Paecilomyces variotii]KAJ9385040.1 hypothetical protein DTO032I4_4433 [Paecilomyces variotii]
MWIGLEADNKQRPNSPHQPNSSIPSGTYATAHGLGNGVPLQHQTPYGQPTQEPTYYTTHPSHYTSTSAPGQYPSSRPPDLMAATAQMQRPYPPIYHTPQSNSPASVASQTHDQHGRNLYTQSPQMPSQMYGYQPYSSMNSVHPSPYAPHPASQQHALTSQSLMIPHQTGAAQMHPQPQGHPAAMTTNSPQQLKLDSIPSQATPPQRTPINPPHSTPATGQVPQNNVHANGAAAANPNAAPGPIPATTPLVVRQDSNGVQWIAFEYSRDRVKMEYTIRCDVESVNVDNLSQEFKTENCVYPRACCSKDQYRGNRLVYETECNAVGWALAELNPPLRGKRGLIQRAVDSWRNSNQDPRLRSRRVRRLAKINRRQTVQSPQPSHIAAPTSALPGVPGPGLTAPGPRPPPGSMSLGGGQLHHHHAHHDGSTGNEEVSGGTGYTNGTHRSSDATSGHQPPGHGTTDLRTGQIFHGFPMYPPSASASGAPGGPSMPPLQASSMGSFSRHGTIATSSNRREEDDNDDDERNPDNAALFGDLPQGKRRKFILVDDSQRGCRVRVKVMLDQVDMNEIPDSYRQSNSVYPRTYFPVQMKSPPGRVVPGKRYFDDDDEEDDDGSTATVGRTLVPAPSIDGETDIAVPKLSRSKHNKEILLNDLGYRMSWSQSRVFAGRTLFLQRSLDAYRNKMRNTMLNAGQETTSIAPHFETRIGKRKFLERSRKKSSLSAATAAVATSASQRSAEEVEG